MPKIGNVRGRRNQTQNPNCSSAPTRREDWARAFEAQNGWKWAFCPYLQWAVCILHRNVFKPAPISGEITKLSLKNNAF